MKTDQFRYVLFLLVLAFFGVTFLGYSEEATEKSNGEPNSSEKSHSLKTQGTESEREKQSPEPELIPAASQEPLRNLFPIYSTVFGAVIVLVLAIAIFLVVRVRGLEGKVNAGERFEETLNESKRDWEEQLKHVNQQGRDGIQELHSAIRNEQENRQKSLSELGSRLDNLQLKLANSVPESVPDRTVDVEAMIQEAQAKVESLAQAYENGEPIDFIEIDNPTPSQKALTILNWIARTIKKWKNELQQSGTGNPDLIQTLEFANQAIKDKLKEVRGAAPPLPEPLKPDTDVSTDAAYNEFKNRCTAYVSHYEGVLVGYQVGRQTAETEYNQFILQFIKDRLFNGVARFVKFDQLPKQVDEFLQIVGYEVVPIEIGETKADVRMHDIQSSRQTNAESGTIVEVVLPGLQRITDGEIVQKPVVIRGE